MWRNQNKSVDDGGRHSEDGGPASGPGLLGHPVAGVDWARNAMSHPFHHETAKSKLPVSEWPFYFEFGTRKFAASRPDHVGRCLDAEVMVGVCEARRGGRHFSSRGILDEKYGGKKGASEVEREWIGSDSSLSFSDDVGVKSCVVLAGIRMRWRKRDGRDGKGIYMPSVQFMPNHMVDMVSVGQRNEAERTGYTRKVLHMHMSRSIYLCKELQSPL